MERQSGKTVDAVQLQEGYRRYPIDDHGKLRFQYASFVAASALAQNDTIGLFWLPPGRKRVLPHLSRVATSAFGSGRTLDVGHGAYLKRPPGNSLEVEDVDAFVDGLDVSAQVTAGTFNGVTGLKFDMYSLDETLVFATVLGGTMPQNATLEILLAYLYE